MNTCSSLEGNAQIKRAHFVQGINGKYFVFIKNTTEQKHTPIPVAKGLEADVPGILAVTWVKKQPTKKTNKKHPHQLTTICIKYHSFYIVSIVNS